jgi:hypothetical protein
MGAGTRLLEKEEAEQLAQELNRAYPGIYHEAVYALPAGDAATAGFKSVSAP